MSIKIEDKNSFVITITRNWCCDLELWVKKKRKKFASVIANYLPAWLCKMQDLSVLPLLTPECQKIALKTTWDGDTPLWQVNVDAQAIINTEIDCLIDCDNIFLGTTGSNIVAIKDNAAIGSFISTNT